MSETKRLVPPVPAAAMAEAAMACMRSTAELQSRLAAGWMDVFTHGMAQPAAVATWSMEAMRLTAETTMRNIEHCQECARRTAAEQK